MTTCQIFLTSSLWYLNFQKYSIKRIFIATNERDRMFKQYRFLKSEIENIGNTTYLYSSHKGTIYSFVDDLEEVPEKKVNNAKKSFGQGISSDETLLLLFDSTLFGSASEGIIFTDKRIYAKESFSDPLCIDYKDIENVKADPKTGAITVTCKNGIKKLQTGVYKDNYLLFWNLIQFILGYSAILKVHSNSGSILSNAEAQELYDEVSWYSLQSVEESESVFDNFFDKYGSLILGQLGAFTLSQLDSDETWDLVVGKLYELLPAPVRMIVSKETVKEMVISNKNKIIERFNS